MRATRAFVFPPTLSKAFALGNTISVLGSFQHFGANVFPIVRIIRIVHCHRSAPLLVATWARLLGDACSIVVQSLPQATTTDRESLPGNDRPSEQSKSTVQSRRQAEAAPQLGEAWVGECR